MGIRFKRGLEMRGPVRVCFELPKTKLAVKAAGEIAWTDQLGNTGVRFVQMNKRTAQDLHSGWRSSTSESKSIFVRMATAGSARHLKRCSSSFAQIIS